MLVACWSAKGGSGTTVVAVALAVLHARKHPVLLVDLGGDVPAVLGMPPPDGPGVLDWVAAGADVGADALDRLAVDVAPSLRLVPRGEGTGPGDRLAGALAGRSDIVVVDCGPPGDPVGTWVAASAEASLLVTRPCYLAVARAHAVAPSIRPSGVVVVDDGGHLLRLVDVSEAAGAPVLARVPFDPAVSRAVDAGSLATSMPRVLARRLRGAL